MTIKLIWDRRECTVIAGDITLQAAPENHAPFTTQAIVEEQDSHLLLGTQTSIRDPGKPAWYLANTLERDERTYTTGHVLYKPGKPARLLAIVHDIEKNPTCNEADIVSAWQNLARIIEKVKIRSAAIPLLGCVHGKVAPEHALELLKTTLLSHSPAGLEKIWLILPDNINCEDVKNLLQPDSE